MENENKLNYSMKRYRDKLKKQKKENNRYNKKYKKFKKHKEKYLFLNEKNPPISSRKKTKLQRKKNTN